MFRKQCLRLALLSGLVLSFPCSALAETDDRPRVYGSAKHSRIYFRRGVEAFADEAIDYKPGAKKAQDLWRDSRAALGAPDFKDFEKDRLSRQPTFLSLGSAGTVTIRFADNALINGPGADLYIFEPADNITPVSIEISRDGKDWISLGADTTTAQPIDIGDKGEKNATYNYVRITDASLPDAADQWPGADIDAVGALNSAPKISFTDSDLWPSAERIGHEKRGAEATKAASPPDLATQLNKVIKRWTDEKPMKLLIEVYSQDVDGKHSKGQSEEKDKGLAKQRSEEVLSIVNGQSAIPADLTVVDFFEHARAIARRDVLKEHERDNRFDFILLPFDRVTVAGGTPELKLQQDMVLVDGKWDSNLGEVIIEAYRDPENNSQHISGEWQESPARKGVMQGGSFDSKTGMLTFSFYRQWSNMRGNAEVQLGMDATKLRGIWRGEVSGSGDWTMTRQK